MRTPFVLALSGGIGGAKLALGLHRVLEPGALTVVANTGDDFVHLGLHISPDIDTILYTLTGLADPNRGWGRRDETWNFMSALTALGGEDWFALGDRDLALHVERTRRLQAGQTLYEATEALRCALGLGTRVIPTSNDPVRTRLRSDDGWLDFQDYFVRRRCEPMIREIAYAGADIAEPEPSIIAELQDPQLRAVVICPSNPMLSIEPALAMPGLRAAIRECRAPVVAVSPIIAGKAVKGPTAKLMRELGMEASATAAARRYEGLLDAYVHDISETEAIELPGVSLRATMTLMKSMEDRDALARAVLSAADDLRRRPD